MYDGFMCVHILQVTGTGITNSRYITNVIHTNKSIPIHHTHAALPYSHAVYGHYQWTWLTIEGSATSTLDA